MLKSFDDGLNAGEMAIADRVSDSNLSYADEEPELEMEPDDVEAADVAEGAEPVVEEAAGAAAADDDGPEAAAHNPGHKRGVSNGGCSDTSDFVYDGEEAAMRPSGGRPEEPEKRDMRLLYVVTSIQRPEELRKWVANASDADALGMVHAVRQLQDSWMSSEASLINANVSSPGGFEPSHVRRSGAGL